jgi:ribosomal protein S12 methylthiotransferase accessory factor
LGFCRKRGIPAAGIRLIQRLEADAATKMVRKVLLEIQLPPEFPEQYAPAVVRAAESCLVRKHLEKPPLFEARTSASPVALP